MSHPIFRITLALIFLLGGLLSPAAPTAASAQNGLSPEPYISADGTFAIPPGFSGSFDLRGWDVTLDPVMGPRFAPLKAVGDWSALGNNGAGNGALSNLVTTLAVLGGDLYVGGFFTNINNNGTPLPEADYITRWDGANWHALSSNGAGDGALSGNVRSLAVIGNDLYVGGFFTNVNNNGTPLPEADYISRWDGTNWHALGSNGAGDGSVNNVVRALAVIGNDLYVGGDFVNVNNNGTPLPEADRVARWDGTDWHALGSNGAGNGSFINGQVYALAAMGSDLYVGGAFFNINNNGISLPEADYVARWDGTDWHALGSNGAGNGALTNAVFALTAIGTDLYVGGQFINVNNNGTPLPEADRIARWDGTNWHALSSDGAGNGSLNNAVTALMAIGTDLYVGGFFTNINHNGTPLPEADYIALWDGSDWHALGSNGAGGGALTGAVRALVPSGVHLYAGGDFTNVNNNGVALPEADYVARTQIGIPPSASEAASGAGNGCAVDTDGGQCKVGDVWVSVPAGALPASAVGCRIVIEDVGAASEYGLSLNERVYDVRVICENGSVSVFTTPITVCIRPQDGVTSSKQLFHNHSGAGFNALPASSVRAGHVCGTTSQLSLFVIGGLFLPDTGFAPGVLTQLPAQPAELAYASTDLMLSIPRLGVQTAIVGVPQSADGWDVTWLGGQAGYLYGTAFPTWAGNTVITAHVWDANNNPGPFAKLADLQHGDRIEIAAFGQTYVYEVRTSASLRPTDTRKAFASSQYDLLTLITCEGFDARTGEYLARRVVTAVLVAIR